MGIKSGVKRKSINKSETPNKLCKTDDAVNPKTPNTSHNTPAKNQKTPQTINASKSPKTSARKQKKSQKKNKHIPEEDEEQSENDSEEEVEVNLNEELGSDEESLEDSKVAKVDEQGLDSDEEQNENEKEDEQNDSDEDQNENEKEENKQTDSDEDSDAEEVIKQPNPKKQTHLDRCKFTVYVNGLRGADFRVPDIFKNCNHTFYTMLKNHKTGKYTGSAFVNFDEEENYKKALEKNGTVINGVTISVLPKRTKEDENQTYNIFVGNLSRDSKIENIFADCKIVTRKIFPHSKSALLCLEDEDSIQKALEKNQTKHDGNTLTVQRKDCSVFVKGLTKNIKLDEFFSDCKIHNYKLHQIGDTNKFSGTASVHFEDILSYKNALAKNGTEFEGRTIKVESIKPIENRNKSNNGKKKNQPKRDKPFFNKNTNKPFKKNTNKPFVKKNTVKTFAGKNNPTNSE